MGRLSSIILLALCVIQLSGTGLAWGGQDKVKLKDVEVLTLHTGAMTTGRRSSPVPQLRCVGGSANGAFAPQVVQCYNKGSDGYDVQWECKTDMDNAYRFGKISVTCEGYDYPDDPYVLKGSCGLEYTLDLTGSGNAQYQQQGGSSDYGWNPNVYGKPQKKGDLVTNLACGAVVVVIVYAIYKICISPTEQMRQRSNTSDDNPRRPGPGTGGGSSPPPPGFRSDYYSAGNDGGYFSGGDSCGANSQGSSSSGSGMGRNAGGFWTGAAAGGLLGYMFGNRNNTYQQGAYYRPSTSRGFGGGSSSWGGGSSWGSSGSGSSGSRSSSGFGGTSRR
ncbi:unnamed protein product [Orchesella dallaii]|uniref:Store-operated calcium entry-associated regulatory factor n=1 Tax=Orchesella dallaii TaxID=48710 RepID=A0ABP1PVD9_9HEXA